MGGADYTVAQFRLIAFSWIGAVAALLGKTRNQITLNSATEGSVIIDSSVTVSQGENSETVFNNAATELSTADTIGGLSVESTNVERVGFSAEEDDSSNLGLILGVSIPIGLIILAAVVFAIVKIGKREKYLEARDDELDSMSNKGTNRNDDYI
jgi:hypothetical protein